ncbi:MAG: Glutamyl-tRNA(Gln) amidotransferase subunit E [Candidatus Methanofastidiosum methylothiophilum]|jgi:glutamyl-tRNA(Gln) amidotransferase subunit E|uniref:Glutamyl-tRNA(Gln) amidotransferase subunit E n=1 Tax=Candidatus Methanofastidiosum methylothiophilum TaxID=1705564 RepID=A0A150JEW0_9EURY|nr:MAG: Glutamyl-tRNA(Gln) amidotransferase subunit E [Candidatus Methanofastidiosum methylthiophilus]MBP6931843.1 Glu-tRNA(Gln) amidotransferase subunit GatE [Methanofastidiosum sp.]OQC50982.1 MAG: Glutamyl-tRNA(Gln) amidotransferase subunit E [Euryarchaeota archaeon ADurb.Bin023]KYC55760.1 MAG: Glutamyl-tRNA(Gln) amidotransferase subunit E [Candidatus Methanofastidiosum methylthiophilus]KYC56789.1 MAG: Glutamyl-tRNA(Gln) amidotransferase subunit E [Candidatus Methanofastidiosum methylthiophil
MDYNTLGLKIGLEIHQQLNTDRKLFCHCPTILRIDEPIGIIERKLRPTPSEIGEIDIAALKEYMRGKTFIYQYFDSNCLVELDEEPPHLVSEEAKKIGVEVSLLLNSNIVEEIQVMRKTVLDGSNTSAFQRTMLISTDGYINTKEGLVSILTVCLEEDAARLVSQDDTTKTFRLDRLGIPLIEIATGPDISNPMQAKEAAYILGQILRATGKVKRGLGTIRQDLNISIIEGGRVELKGVQKLEMIPLWIEREIERQINLVKIRNELNKRGSAEDLEFNSIEITDIFKDTTSKIIGNSIKNYCKVYSIKLKNFKGILGTEIQKNRRFGTELADHAKTYGISGLFHLDELPNYGITTEEIQKVKNKLEINELDSFVIVTGKEDICYKAIEEIFERCKKAFLGVPNETRDALEDGNSKYSRPLPGRARMYPETDIPPFTIEQNLIDNIKENLPETFDEIVSKFVKKYGLKKEEAEKIAYEAPDLFEKVTSSLEIKPSIFIKALDISKNLEKEEGYVTDDGTLYLLFEKVSKGIIAKEGIEEVLKRVSRGENPEKVISEFSSENSFLDIETFIEKIILEKKDFILEKKERAISPLMGLCMKEFRGKVDGSLINKILDKKIREVIEYS